MLKKKIDYPFMFFRQFLWYLINRRYHWRHLLRHCWRFDDLSLILFIVPVMTLSCGRIVGHQAVRVRVLAN